MSLTKLITQHAAALAAASDFAGVSALLTDRNIQLPGIVRSSKETLVGLMQLGVDTDAILTAFDTTQSGKSIVAYLHQNGINWTDPLTVGMVAKNTTGPDGITQDQADALYSLSVNLTSLAEQDGLTDAQCTPALCSSAWLVNADVLLSVNRTGGTLRISLNVSRNGQQVRLASMTEGQGSVVDQALLTAVETAIDTWLQVGG